MLTHVRLSSLASAPLRHSLDAYHYALWWARHPKPGSIFEKTVKSVQYLPGPILFALLQLKKYDGLVFFNSNTIVGHCYFQERDAGIHFFSIGVDPKYRGLKLSYTILREFYLYAYTKTRHVRLGMGTEPVMQVLHDKVAAGRLGELPFELTTLHDYWFRIEPRESVVSKTFRTAERRMAT